MMKGADSWLTLAEVIHRSNFNNIETRRLIKRFGKFLGPRNFGDIVKYPPEAVAVVIRIGELYRQGYTTEEITAILSRKDHLPEEPPYDQLQQEVDNLLKLQDEACKMLRATSETVEKMMSDMVVLTAKLAAAEAEIKNLKEKNRKYRAENKVRKLEDMN